MMYAVHIQDTMTNEVVVYLEDCGRNNPHGRFDDVDRYMWEDGNYACDCNRSLFFNRAKGIELDDHLGCGDELYRVVCIVDRDGLVVYSEPEPEERGQPQPAPRSWPPSIVYIRRETEFDTGV